MRARDTLGGTRTGRGAVGARPGTINNAEQAARPGGTRVGSVALSRAGPGRSLPGLPQSARSRSQGFVPALGEKPPE